MDMTACTNAPSTTALPRIIQGGLGVAVSHWYLARTVSSLGQLGVISGTALDQVLTRRLQDGDPGGHMREAFGHFPVPEMAERVWSQYYIAGGKRPDQPYKVPPMQAKDGPRAFRELCVVANFAEVWLARQGHSNPVGVNFMEKLQPPHLPSIYGAMLAGADFILMGAGIPMKIPGVLDHFVNHEPATYPLYVAGATPEDDTLMHFDPSEYVPNPAGPLKRPMFLAIIASNTLAITLARKANGKVDGFIIEGPTAGGHNAPPRGQLQLNEIGEPVYGDRDRVDLPKLCSLGLPFWLAGGYGTPEGLREAVEAGAAGIQVGTAFALCEESGMREDYRRALIDKILAGQATVFTDRLASPTGFPFKVASLEGTISEEEVFAGRPKLCDLGYLREAYREADGHIAFRCPAEPDAVFLAKGGNAADIPHRKCVCNGLLSSIGAPQVRAGGYLEPGIVTAGDDLVHAGRFIAPGARSYTAADVIRNLLSGLE
jgi:nitronate monooxygenase